MAGPARGTLPPHAGDVHLPPSDGDNILIERLASRVRRLEALVQSMEQHLAAQLRRTGEIQAQLDRAVVDLRRK